MGDSACESPSSWLLVTNSNGLPVLSVRSSGSQPSGHVPLSTQGIVAGLHSAAAQAGIRINMLTMGPSLELSTGDAAESGTKLAIDPTTGAVGAQSTLHTPATSRTAAGAGAAPLPSILSAAKRGDEFDHILVYEQFVNLSHPQDKVLFALSTNSVRRPAVGQNGSPSSSAAATGSNVGGWTGHEAAAAPAHGNDHNGGTASASDDHSVDIAEIEARSSMSFLCGFLRFWLGSRDWWSLAANPNQRPIRQRLASAARAVDAVLRHGIGAAAFSTAVNEPQLFTPMIASHWGTMLDLSMHPPELEASVAAPFGWSGSRRINSRDRRFIAAEGTNGWHWSSLLPHVSLEPQAVVCGPSADPAHLEPHAVSVGPLSTFLHCAASAAGATQAATIAGGCIVATAGDWSATILPESAALLVHTAATLTMPPASVSTSPAATSAGGAASPSSQHCTAAFECRLVLREPASSSASTASQTHASAHHHYHEVPCCVTVVCIGVARGLSPAFDDGHPAPAGDSSSPSAIVSLGTRLSPLRVVFVRPLEPAITSAGSSSKPASGAVLSIAAAPSGLTPLSVAGCIDAMSGTMSSMSPLSLMDLMRSLQLAQRCCRLLHTRSMLRMYWPQSVPSAPNPSPSRSSLPPSSSMSASRPSAAVPGMVGLRLDAQSHVGTHGHSDGSLSRDGLITAARIRVAMHSPDPSSSSAAVHRRHVDGPRHQQSVVSKYLASPSAQRQLVVLAEEELLAMARRIPQLLHAHDAKGGGSTGEHAAASSGAADAIDVHSSPPGGLAMVQLDHALQKRQHQPPRVGSHAVLAAVTRPVRLVVHCDGSSSASSHHLDVDVCCIALLRDDGKRVVIDCCVVPAFDFTAAALEDCESYTGVDGGADDAAAAAVLVNDNDVNAGGVGSPQRLDTAAAAAVPPQVLTSTASPRLKSSISPAHHQPQQPQPSSSRVRIQVISSGSGSASPFPAPFPSSPSVTLTTAAGAGVDGGIISPPRGLAALLASSSSAAVREGGAPVPVRARASTSSSSVTERRLVDRAQHRHVHSTGGYAAPARRHENGNSGAMSRASDDGRVAVGMPASGSAAPSAGARFATPGLSGIASPGTIAAVLGGGSRRANG